MSHTTKFKAAGAGQLGAHVDRTRGTEHAYANERIDPARSVLNYDLSGCSTPLSQLVAQAVEAAPKTVRKDAVLLGSTVTTLPRNWPTGRDPREFFEAVRAFDLAFWPDSFVEARATVHMDETTPHMHHVFIPLDDSGQPNWSNTYTRAMYQRYHSEMAEAVRAATGLPDLRILIPEEEAGEKALSGLSQPDYIAARGELARIERESLAAQERLERLRREEEGLAAEVEELQPLAETVVDSARYLAEHRGDAEREEALAGEIERLRGRIAGCEGELRGCREREGRAVAERVASAVRVAGCRERIAGCRDRIAGYRRRIAAAGERIGELAGSVTGVVYTVSVTVAQVLGEFGVNVQLGEPPRPTPAERFANAKAAAIVAGRARSGGGRAR